MVTVLQTASHEEAMSYLALARERFTQSDIARQLQVDARTIRRWEARQSAPPPYIVAALRQLILPLHDLAAGAGDFRFIDLFAGVGGIRRAFSQPGAVACLPVNGTVMRKKPIQKIILQST